MALVLVDMKPMEIYRHNVSVQKDIPEISVNVSKENFNDCNNK